MAIKIKNKNTGKIIKTVEANNLAGIDLKGADLYEANLRGANLYKADLKGANLKHAYLYEADLKHADLTGADLTDAKLRNADLRYADLKHADLTGADLTGADLRFTCVYNFMFGRDQAFFHKSKHYKDGHILKIGCIDNTVDWWLENHESEGLKAGYNQKEIKLYGDMIKSLKGLI